jgi:hypothetical protein
MFLMQLALHFAGNVIAVLHLQLGETGESRPLGDKCDLVPKSVPRKQVKSMDIAVYTQRSVCSKSNYAQQVIKWE